MATSSPTTPSSVVSRITEVLTPEESIEMWMANAPRMAAAGVTRVTPLDLRMWSLRYLGRTINVSNDDDLADFAGSSVDRSAVGTVVVALDYNDGSDEIGYQIADGQTATAVLSTALDRLAIVVARLHAIEAVAS